MPEPQALKGPRKARCSDNISPAGRYRFVSLADTSAARCHFRHLSARRSPLRRTFWCPRRLRLTKLQGDSMGRAWRHDDEAASGKLLALLGVNVQSGKSPLYLVQVLDLDRQTG